MRVAWYSVALLASALISSQADAADTSKINGWFPCHESSAQRNASAPPLFECAEVEAPMCHSGVCDSAKTVNLFVKRLLAKKPTVPRKALWFLQGGPGFGSVGSALANLSAGHERLRMPQWDPLRLANDLV